jgi:hypothetical protein
MGGFLLSVFNPHFPLHVSNLREVGNIGQRDFTTYLHGLLGFVHDKAQYFLTDIDIPIVDFHHGIVSRRSDLPVGFEKGDKSNFQ